MKDRIRQRLQDRRDQHLWRTRFPIDSRDGRWVTIAGNKLLNFCSNDYLGMAEHPDVIQAGVAALHTWGAGSGASHLVCGHLAIHERLESRIAQFVGAEKAIVFSTGYMANLALPATFLDRHDLLLEDKQNHASMLDAGQLCLAKMKRYPHRDVATAQRWLENSDAPQKMLMTDGVFSMDGDVAPVVQLDALCRQQETLLVVDDAHGLGVLGERGGGTLEAHGVPVTDHVLMMGTLGKAAGNFGAFVAGDALWIESLLQFARPMIYTTALPPSVVGATLAAIDVIEQDQARRDRLNSNVDHFRELAQKAGLASGHSSTPIQPVMIGSAQAAMRVSDHLRENGFWVSAIRPPTVAAGTSRLRITLTSEHQTAEIDRLVELIVEATDDAA